MSRILVRNSLLASLLIAAASIGFVQAEDSAPSSHLVFDDNFAGDVLVNSVRVPADGEALYTYYETLGWRGRAGGYAGIQAHPKSHLFIFSVWDHKEHRAPIHAVHVGPGTKIENFGGEGTGLKSWNFDLGWKTDVWYTLVARAWPVTADDGSEHTYCGFWSRASDTKQWTHLVTMDVAAKDAYFEGGTDAFLEDWLNTGAKRREVHYRDGWKRKLDGTWYPFGAARYSVNAWDLEPGKRSYNFRRSWNGGVRTVGEEEFYFMTAGGADTQPTAENPSTHSIARPSTTRPGFETPEPEDVRLAPHPSAGYSVTWKASPTTSPQFGYRVEYFAGEQKLQEPLKTIIVNSPEATRHTVDDRLIEQGATHIRFLIVDIFGQESDATVLPL